ncbi:MAG: NAD(P)-dependent glycerol-3-phosphate dehydrogenase [Candidatus Omnitrophica bacterium]|nr:NAD(P)-dependent glycerol-3-phosphate dehydrogenase [Candidatus Omnitrophota bacterium]MDD5352555.1 NAD(P)-dependent glycerol-3-phosphate dehydrogenase [Candidatus Omnitrophota bacterium]MDD5550153.1 NAD(P)-dependent glycerol-3-phosphate dehydrogenase [Candidatus Omnitrophota bacterium]
MLKRQNITILGDGGWGTTLSILLSKKGYNVCLWGIFRDYTESLKKKRVNSKFLKGIKIPKEVFITSDLKEALCCAQTIILAVPSQYLRSVLKKIKGTKTKDRLFLSATKGIEYKSLMTMSEVITDELGGVNLAVLSGPNIAQEIARGMPAVSVVASKNHHTAGYFQNLLMNEKFRVYTNSDVVGVELGGSLKNIIALACGISDGLKLGTNAKAALLTRGLVEISRLGVAMGANRETFFGVSGLGDLVTTCTSLYSRNRFVGEQIAKGKRLSDIEKDMQMVAEGVSTTKAAYTLAGKYNVEMPITKEIYCVLYKHKAPQKALKDLMLRRRKAEQ